MKGYYKAVRYFKVKDDIMFIPDDKIIRLFRSRKDGEWYVTLPDWTNVKIESPCSGELWQYGTEEEDE